LEKKALSGRKEGSLEDELAVVKKEDAVVALPISLLHQQPRKR